AAKTGGGDPDSNARLRTAILAAKAENMPSDNITRAIKKGTGELEGAAAYEDVIYEGYGPGGTALMVEVLTDNKNRTVSDIRHIFTRSNGNLGESGSVAWMFKKKGIVTVPASSTSEDTIMEAGLEAGAEDVISDGDIFMLYTDPSSLESVRSALESKSVKIEKAEISMIPQTTVKLSGKDAETMLKLIENLEDNDDVQKVHSNFDIDDEEMAKLSV
ncbi:MAG TPA: YebC/PmpR family DNA-binding transcriptional regulator, partial [bacterium]|nr:YebC/PmpR family DNA-binding transcriptional regulator [bacterium]